jgi:hypothetical protein
LDFSPCLERFGFPILAKPSKWICVIRLSLSDKVHTFLAILLLSLLVASMTADRVTAQEPEPERPDRSDRDFLHEPGRPLTIIGESDSEYRECTTWSETHPGLDSWQYKKWTADLPQIEEGFSKSAVEILKDSSAGWGYETIVHSDAPYSRPWDYYQKTLELGGSRFRLVDRSVWGSVAPKKADDDFLKTNEISVMKVDLTKHHLGPFFRINDRLLADLPIFDPTLQSVGRKQESLTSARNSALFAGTAVVTVANLRDGTNAVTYFDLEESAKGLKPTAQRIRGSW